MRSLRFLDRRAGNRIASIALILGTLVPSLIPALASAANVSSRSIILSTAAANASNVSYEVQFTPATDAEGFVIDFCSDSPIAGQTCTAPSGFSTASVASASDTVAALTVNSNSNETAVAVTKSMTATTPVDVTLTGIHNPTSANDSTHGFYARIITYATAGEATGYADSTSIGTPVDTGGVAMSIVSAIGVTAAVRETMTFCVASADITPDCANAGGNLPTFELGETVGNAKALSPSAISTANLYTQLSTNAASGAVVNLKSSATGCGGLIRLGSSACDITPALTNFTAGNAKFGVKTAADSTAATGAQSPTGHLLPSSGYGASGYYLHYVAGDGSGVTSTYGDPFLNTNSLPVNNQNQQITLGASASANTPAGTYGATLNMIAAGTY